MVLRLALTVLKCVQPSEPEMRVIAVAGSQRVGEGGASRQCQSKSPGS